MKVRTLMFVTILFTLCLLTSVSVFAADTEVGGMIAGRAGDTMIVRGSSGQTVVVLTDQTKIKDNTGLFGLDRAYMADTVLIPGLKVKVDGTTDEHNRVMARIITVDGDDLETSQMISAGLNPTAEQVADNVKTLEAHSQQLQAQQGTLQAHRETMAAQEQDIAANKEKIERNIKDTEENTQRFMSLAEYDVKGDATVKFASGSTKISAKDQEELKKLAETVAALKGWIIEVIGYTDSTGSAAMNTKLSEDRAKAVVTFLVQQGKISPRYIVAPGAMGEYGAAAPNENKGGRAENRRVEVKILVNKGIRGA